MKVSVRQKDLVRELGLAETVVDPHATIPILGHVLLETRDDSLSLTCTDLDLGIRTSCTAAVEEPGTTPLPLETLYKYVRLLPDADVTIEADPESNVTLSCGSANTRLAGLVSTTHAERFPTLPEVPDTLTEIPVSAVSSAIGRTQFSIASEQAHFAISSAHLKLTSSNFGIVTTDGHRLSYYFEPGSYDGVGDGEVTALISRKAMKALLRVLSQSEGGSDTVQFASDTKSLYFRCGRRQFSARKVEGKFPDYSRVMPRELSTTVKLSTQEFRRVVTRVKQFANPKSPAIRLHLESGELKLSASTSGVGRSEESMVVDFDGKPFGLGFNADYIAEFLQVCGAESVLMRFRDQQSAAQLEVAPTEGEESQTDYRYVIMPVRV